MCLRVCVSFFTEFLGLPCFRNVAIYTNILKALNCLVVNCLSGSLTPVIFKFKYLHTHTHTHTGFSGGSEMIKNPPAMQDTQVRSLGWEEPLEKGMTTHSSILAWKSPGTEEPHRWLQTTGLQRVGHDWMTERNHDDVKTYIQIFCFPLRALWWLSSMWVM